MVKLEKLKKELYLTKTQLKTITTISKFDSVNNYKPIEKNTTKKPVCINILLSDWHIGETVNLKHNTYNIDYACARLERL